VIFRYFARHTFSRRFVVWLVIVVGFLCVNRAARLGTRLGVPGQLAHDDVLFAVGFAVGAIWTFRLILLAAALFVMAAVVSAFYPELAVGALSITGLMAIAVVALAVARGERDATGLDAEVARR
jgi:hypothetical protein